MNSLKNRLLLASTIVLILFGTIVGMVLDYAHTSSALASVSIRLQSQIYEVLSVADLEDKDNLLDLPASLPNSHLMEKKSGYYASIAYEDKVYWASPSNEGLNIPYNTNLKPGEQKFTLIQADDGSDLFLLSLGYSWGDDDENPIYYTFNAAESDSNYNRELSAFRYNLWTWLFGIIALSLVIQTIVLNWGFKPLVKLRKDLNLIEEGKREYLDGNYIDEIKELTKDLNTLLKFERARQKRYRNSLGDLAHSFKTSLSIINSTLNTEIINKRTKSALVEQVDVLSDLVTYQLRRAQASGTKASLSKPVKVAVLVDKIKLALAKVYQDKNISFVQRVDQAAMFYGDKGDLLEVLGNLLDNAHKWCKAQVVITCEEIKTENTVLIITVEDDGSGIEDDKKQKILKRGVRSDEQTPGHGIGMSIVADIIAAYEGQVTVADSALGGAKFVVTFLR